MVPRRDLLQEQLGFETQSDDVDAEHPITRQDESVLAKVVEHDVESGSVLRAVDLHHEVAAAPPNIEVDASARAAPDHLAAGFGEALEAAQPGEVELAQGLDAEGDVPHDSADERATRPAADLTVCLGQQTGRREVLLDGHEQH